MREVEITTEMLEHAKRKADDMGVLKRSYLSGEGNVTGFLGEIIAANVLGASTANESKINYNYDLIIPSTGITIDVKTKKTKVKPLPHYECGVMDYNAKTQKCDYYCFVRIKSDLTVGWFLGVKEKYQYIREARFIPKGYEEPNGFKAVTDNYNMPISRLDDEIRPDSIKANVFLSFLNRRTNLDSKEDYETLLENIKKWITKSYKI